jgi:hypothetical protein
LGQASTNGQTVAVKVQECASKLKGFECDVTVDTGIVLDAASVKSANFVQSAKHYLKTHNKAVRKQFDKLAENIQSSVGEVVNDSPGASGLQKLRFYTAGLGATPYHGCLGDKQCGSVVKISGQIHCCAYVIDHGDAVAGAVQAIKDDFRRNLLVPSLLISGMCCKCLTSLLLDAQGRFDVLAQEWEDTLDDEDISETGSLRIHSF